MFHSSWKIEDLPRIFSSLITNSLVSKKCPKKSSNTVELMEKDGSAQIRRLWFLFVRKRGKGKINWTRIYYYRYSTWNGGESGFNSSKILLSQNPKEAQGAGKLLLIGLWPTVLKKRATGMMCRVPGFGNEPAKLIFTKILPNKP